MTNPFDVDKLLDEYPVWFIPDNGDTPVKVAITDAQTVQIPDDLLCCAGRLVFRSTLSVRNYVEVEKDEYPAHGIFSDADKELSLDERFIDAWGDFDYDKWYDYLWNTNED